MILRHRAGRIGSCVSCCRLCCVGWCFWHPFRDLCWRWVDLFSDLDRRDAISAAVQDMYRSVIERPEFMVKVIAIHGASPALDMDIREVMPVELPVSQFDLDLQEIYGAITELDPVAEARIHVKQGGTLKIDVVERVQPVCGATAIPSKFWMLRGALCALLSAA